MSNYYSYEMDPNEAEFDKQERILMDMIALNENNDEAAQREADSFLNIPAGDGEKEHEDQQEDQQPVAHESNKTQQEEV